MLVFGASVQGMKGMTKQKPGLSLIGIMGHGHARKLPTIQEQRNITVNQAHSLILFQWIM